MNDIEIATDAYGHSRISVDGFTLDECLEDFDDAEHLTALARKNLNESFVKLADVLDLVYVLTGKMGRVTWESTNFEPDSRLQLLTIVRVK